MNEPARSSVTVAAVQFDGRPGDVEANLRSMVRLIGEAATPGVDLVALAGAVLGGA